MPETSELESRTKLRDADPRVHTRLLAPHKTGISSPTVRWKHAAKAVRSHITGLLRYESTGIGCVMWRERVARQAPRLFPRSGCGACTIVLVRFRCPAATAISFEGMRHLGFVKGVTWVLDPIVLIKFRQDSNSHSHFAEIVLSAPRFDDFGCDSGFRPRNRPATIRRTCCD